MSETAAVSPRRPFQKFTAFCPGRREKYTVLYGRIHTYRRFAVFASATTLLSSIQPHNCQVVLSINDERMEPTGGRDAPWSCPVTHGEKSCMSRRALHGHDVFFQDGARRKVDTCEPGLRGGPPLKSHWPPQITFGGGLLVGGSWWEARCPGPMCPTLSPALLISFYLASECP
ncbi:hypothetical protein GWK47_049839 [Chionoecetes opilio]|uniref:Uncharacterized protein n=1 Tax=Chionoecetes opilio TaxID=41210 RepID=A0A8J4Y9P4_CHIOP|nr:hypothetical protein GWK47_049839 [Chionoecetes opilio]